MPKDGIIITIVLLEQINSTYAYFTNPENSCHLHITTSTLSHLLLPYYTSAVEEATRHNFSFLVLVFLLISKPDTQL